MYQYYGQYFKLGGGTRYAFPPPPPIQPTPPDTSATELLREYFDCKTLL